MALSRPLNNRFDLSVSFSVMHNRRRVDLVNEVILIQILLGQRLLHFPFVGPFESISCLFFYGSILPKV